MPFAANGQISKAPIPGGIEITQQQYSAALAGMLAGKVINIVAGFAIIDPPTPENPAPEPPPATLEAALAGKLAELDDYRWQMEIGGISLAGIPIRTDANSQAKVTAAYFKALNDPDFEVTAWEAVPGTFVALDNATLIAIGDAVLAHVDATFVRKKALHAQVTALQTIEDVLAFDIAFEWSVLG